MSRQNSITKLMAVLENFFNNSLSNLSLETKIQDLPGWDSMMALQLMLRLEKEFEIKFVLYKFIKIKNIDDIINLISEKI